MHMQTLCAQALGWHTHVWYMGTSYMMACVVCGARKVLCKMLCSLVVARPQQRCECDAWCPMRVLSWAAHRSASIAHESTHAPILIQLTIMYIWIVWCVFLAPTHEHAHSAHHRVHYVCLSVCAVLFIETQNSTTLCVQNAPNILLTAQ